MKNILTENSIDFVANIWVVTCRQAINRNKNTRYLVIIEGVYDEKFKKLLNRLNSNISIINIIFDSEEKNVEIYNIKTDQKGVVSLENFKQRIIDITECKFIQSYAMGSKESTPLSRFFREKMGKGFALTDIDFFLTKNRLFIEEKNFVKEGIGYIGVGQCISFKEIINDIFNGIELMILCIDNNDFYIENFDRINCTNSEYISGWGKMISFKTKKISLEDLLHILK